MNRALFLIFVSFLLLPMHVCNAMVWQDTEEEEPQADNFTLPSAGYLAEEEEAEGEEENEDPIQNNPFGVDERKLYAAELFWLRKMFAVEVFKIKSVCDLDEKQTQKLKVAVKGAAKTEFAAWEKEWNDLVKDYDDNPFNNAPKKRQRNRKGIVIEDADEIDPEIIGRVCELNLFDHTAEPNRKAIDSSFWRKTVKSVLEPEQFEKYDAYLQERKKAHLDARINAFLLRMKKDLGMSDEQSKQYDALIRPEMEKAQIIPGYYETFVFQSYATKYDQTKMKLVLNKDQYQLMKMLLSLSKSYGPTDDQRANNTEGNNVNDELRLIASEVIEEFETETGNRFDEMTQGAKE